MSQDAGLEFSRSFGYRCHAAEVTVNMQKFQATGMLRKLKYVG
jgi:hypothetical protein